MFRVLNLQQICPRKVFVFFSLLFWPVLCFFCIPACLLVSLNSAILYAVFFVSINCFIWSSHIFKYFLLFRFLLFLNFHLLLILLCFVSFPILSQCLFHSPFYCLSEVSLFGCTAILCFQHFARPAG